MSEGIRFRRESAPFNLVLAMSKATDKTETQCRWLLDLPKNLSVEDFVGKFAQLVFDMDAASGVTTVTCAITSAVASTATGTNVISTEIDTPPVVSAGNTKFTLSIAYLVSSGKTTAILSE